MRAVDFACCLLRRMGSMDVSPTEIKVLLALAAGLRAADEIAEQLVIRPCACTLCLRKMEKRALVHCFGAGQYTLAPGGENKVAQLLSFTV
ncbi:MAG: hypothetical protein IKV82_09015 [Akkermansia sp.]|nr:hypothetical protein [Akkermansia sp.]